MAVTYKPLTPKHVSDVIELGSFMHKESEFAPISYNKEKLKTVIGNYANPDNKHMFSLLAFDGDKLVGMLLGYLTNYYFSDEYLATDLLWYVDPEYRGTSVGIRLLKSFDKWSKDKGATECCMGVSTGVTAERTGQLLNKMNFRTVGGIYKKWNS